TKIGNRILAALNELKEKHKLIGDVRGKGLMLGIELVKDRQSKEPAKEECAQVMETCKEMGLLLGKGGLWGQTIRFSPPMCVNEQDDDFLLEVLDRALASLRKVKGRRRMQKVISLVWRLVLIVLGTGLTISAISLV